ncbi:MAG: protein tyrosine phosphatase [Methylococcaceae bacterium]|nr:protein tyrosine phosphatase [Methylococcaceae bacterium]
MRNFLFIFLMLCSSLSFAEPRFRPASWGLSIIGTELDNFYWVDAGIYRSEQPDDDNFSNLSKLGIKEILNLREYHSDDEAEEHHFKVHRVKMNAAKVTAAQLLESLKIIKNRKKPILIHCWHGSDRTGVTVAAYRMVFQNWTKEQAIDEMVNGNYGYHSSIYPNLLVLLKSIDIAKMRKDLGLE